MSFYCFTVASTGTGKHKELWVLSTRILAEKIRNTRAKKFPVSEILEVDNDNPLLLASNPFVEYPPTVAIKPIRKADLICNNKLSVHRRIHFWLQYIKAGWQNKEC